MLSMEPFGWKYMLSGWLVILGGPVNLSTQRQRTVGPLKLLFWWRLSDELMNLVQVLELLEAFFDFQDLNSHVGDMLPSEMIHTTLNVDQVVQIGAADACAPQTLVCI